MSLASRRTVFLLLASRLLPAQKRELRGGWSATAGARVLRGTWSAQPDRDGMTCTGEWTLEDEAGQTVAGGTWSARKLDNSWRGSWRALADGGRSAAGTWTAEMKPSRSSKFSDLFEAALAEVVSGAWRAGDRHCGAWSIRTAPEERE